MAGGKIDILVDPDTKGFDSKLAAGLKGVTGTAGKIGKGIALALAAGTAAASFGLSAVIDKGVEYQANLNEMQAVTQATAVDMQKVGRVAKDLGADLSLPATSAADAAAAMVELAKGGLTVNEAMKAAKGTLQLAAAAQIGAAQAAEIQSNALNEFGLSADQAGRVADVLANTANAASGSIVDMANALKFVGPVAKGLSISIDNTSAALGLLANNGIKGEQAGTSLRGILASLASPSKAAAKALETLGVKAFDQAGKFVGLRTITDQLAKAKGKLSEADFAAAASTAFGNEGFTAANALAQSGAKAFDEMAKAVSRAGGAQDVAAAKTKGLGGAIEGFKSQVETAQIAIFEKIAPTLEKGVRGAADVVAKITPAVVSGIDTAVAAGQVFGPRLADALRSRGAVVGKAASDVLKPLAQAIPGLLNAGINTAIDLFGDFTAILAHVVDAAKPVANGIAAVAKASVEANGPVSALLAGLRLGGEILKGLSGVLVPIGQLVGTLAHAFADLPGPIQTVVIALGLLAAFRGPLSSLGDTVTTRVTAPFKSMGEQIRLQQALFDGSSGSVGKFGGALAALETRLPVMQKMRSAFEDGSAGAERFSRTAGLAAAAGVGIKSAAGGIVSAFGGPWGIAIAGASIALSLLAGKQADAAKKAAEHRSAVDGLAGTLRAAGEAAARADIAKSLAAEFKDAAQAAQGFGLSLDDVVDSAIKGKPATDQVATKLRELQEIVLKDPFSEQGKKAFGVLKVFGELGSRYADAATQNRLLDEAIRNGNVSMLDATGAGKTLSGAMNVLKDSTASADDRARALKDALDALSGGQVNLEAAQARLNEQLARLRDAFGENIDKAKGFGVELINADGSINTTTENGRRLFDSLQDIAGSMAEVAQKTFDTARAQGDDLPTALAKAQASAKTTREEFIKQHDQMGLTSGQAEALANRYGLLPEKIATLITAPGMDSTQLELVVLRDLVNKVPPDKSITVRSLSDEAKKKLIDLGFTVTTLPDGAVSVTANTTAAQSSLDTYIKDNSNRTLNIRVVPIVSDAKLRKEALTFDRGGIAAAYASGGVRELRPMSAGVAQIVPPNAWRIIGDRMVDDEAYIPINQSARSMALLQETARRMNMTVIRQFALGGLARVQSGRDALAGLDRPVLNVEKLVVQPLAGRFSMQAVMDELYFSGVR